MSSTSTPVPYLVNLRINKGPPSLLNRRAIAIHPGESITLGRTSKNQKTEFTAKSTNGYFDNPIISRRHAILQNHSGRITVIDQSSTHGTYVNGDKLHPFVPRDVFDGDCITLGTILEPTGRSVTKHFPTELEVGIMEMDGPADINLWMPTATTNETRNSFHAPQDSDSESEEEQQQLPQTIPTTWKPFASRPDIDFIVPESHIRAEPFVREHSSSTSVNIEVPTQQPLQIPPVIDLTAEHPWVVPEPVHIECIEVNSDRDGEYDEDDEYYDEDEDDDEERSDFEFPYEYDSEDKESVNGENELPETKFFQRMESPPITDTIQTVNEQTTQPVIQGDRGDSWNWIKDYLENDGIDTLTDDDDSEYYDEEEELSSMDDYPLEQSEEDEDEEDPENFSDSDDSLDEDEEMSEPQLPSDVVEQLATIIEQPTPIIVEQPIIEQPPTIVETEITVTKIVSPPTPTAEVITQTQTPPITPEQPPTSRKRPLPSNDEEEEARYLPSTETAPILQTTSEPNFPQVEPVEPSREEQSIKRRRIDDEESGKQGWTSVAYSLMKYSVAAGVGGIATIAGLVWAAQQQQQQ